MIDFENKTTYEIVLEEFEKIANKATSGKSLELILTNDSDIKSINREYRGIDKATDVLSFPIKHAKTDFIGSVIISLDTAKKVADELGHTIDEELKILFIHGVLHLLGFDHETDDTGMMQKELEIAVSIGIDKALLSR